MESAVAYLRVSARQQGQSGLGIEAQRSALAKFSEAEGMTIVAEYVEIETGKGTDALERHHNSPPLWPQLAPRNAAYSCRSSTSSRAT
jgi:hypothetical protein